jgi:hypothetical protein
MNGQFCQVGQIVSFFFLAKSNVSHVTGAGEDDKKLSAPIFIFIFIF